MAHIESGPLGVGDSYPLGDYSFELLVVRVPEEDIVSVQARCTKDGQTQQVGKDFPISTQVESWSVEADETEASVYVTIDSQIQPVEVNFTEYTGYYYSTWGPSQYIATFTGEGTRGQFGSIMAWAEGGTWSAQYTYAGKTVNYHAVNGTYPAFFDPRWDEVLNTNGWPSNPGYVAWYMVYGQAPEEDGERLVARFAISLLDAGGTGPDSEWEDPEDSNPDPHKILHLTVTGALSGRHNDPLNDTSYSYQPDDKLTVKPYGYGGDGGHGGGGGAGASAIVVYKFATNRANGKEIKTIAKRHGYGSGGGKGGKGGEGVVLIYY